MNEKEKRYRFAAICYFIGALGMFVSALLGNHSIMNILLGTSFLTLGFAFLGKMKRESGK